MSVYNASAPLVRKHTPTYPPRTPSKDRSGLRWLGCKLPWAPQPTGAKFHQTLCRARTPAASQTSAPSALSNGKVGKPPQRQHDPESSASPKEASSVTGVKHVHTVPNFLDRRIAQRLRGTYDEKFANPSKVSSDRFCWDYWHVPGQYTQMRTPAQEYFEEEHYNALEASLLEYGKEKLGCVGITPVWLSYYVDGCEQELHCDNPHGPWAFVLSLTNWPRRAFVGGETMMLSPGVLNHWATHDAETVVERSQLMTLVEPHFNQLTVFDPRVPHGVRRVSGTRDPREARVVLHGWFVEPEMFVEGPLKFDEAAEVVGACMDNFAEVAETLPEATGTLVLSISVTAGGAVDNISFLTDTLVPRPWEYVPGSTYTDSESDVSESDVSEEEVSSSDQRTRNDGKRNRNRSRRSKSSSAGSRGSGYESGMDSGGSGLDSFDSRDGSSASDTDSHFHTGKGFDSMDSQGSSSEGMYSDDDPIEYIDGSATDSYSSGEGMYSGGESLYSEDEAGYSDSDSAYSPSMDSDVSSDGEDMFSSADEGGKEVSEEVAVRRKLKRAAVKCFREGEYPAKRSGSVVTMPLLFE